MSAVTVCPSAGRFYWALSSPDQEQTFETALRRVAVVFATRRDVYAWLPSSARAKLVAVENIGTEGRPHTPYPSAVEGWFGQPSYATVVPFAWLRVMAISLAGMVSLLGAISYLLAQHVRAAPIWARPLISAIAVVAVMQNPVTRVLSRAARCFLHATGCAARPDGAQ